jgi:hypothetical protein
LRRKLSTIESYLIDSCTLYYDVPKVSKYDILSLCDARHKHINIPEERRKKERKTCFIQ